MRKCCMPRKNVENLKREIRKTWGGKSDVGDGAGGNNGCTLPHSVQASLWSWVLWSRLQGHTGCTRGQHFFRKWYFLLIVTLGKNANCYGCWYITISTNMHRGGQRVLKAHCSWEKILNIKYLFPWLIWFKIECIAFKHMYGVRSGMYCLTSASDVICERETRCIASPIVHQKFWRNVLPHLSRCDMWARI